MAKLWLHTEETLTILDDVTRSLGIALCAFKKEMCSKFATKELPSEAATRQWKWTLAAKKKEKQGREDDPPSSSKKGKGKELCEDNQSSSKKGNGKETLQLPKIFNLNTYKLHSLEDYVNTIRQYGTTDSYSMQIVSQAFPLHSWKVIDQLYSVSYHITILRFPICGLARKNTRNSLSRLKGDGPGFAASGRKFQNHWHQPLMNTLHHVLTIIIRLGRPRTTWKIFHHFCSKISVWRSSYVTGN